MQVEVSLLCLSLSYPHTGLHLVAHTYFDLRRGVLLFSLLLVVSTRDEREGKANRITDIMHWPGIVIDRYLNSTIVCDRSHKLQQHRWVARVIHFGSWQACLVGDVHSTSTSAATLRRTTGLVRQRIQFAVSVRIRELASRTSRTSKSNMHDSKALARQPVQLLGACAAVLHTRIHTHAHTAPDEADSCHNPLMRGISAHRGRHRHHHPTDRPERRAANPSFLPSFLPA